jgi:hypothetical protein
LFGKPTGEKGTEINVALDLIGIVEPLTRERFFVVERQNGLRLILLVIGL